MHYWQHCSLVCVCNVTSRCLGTFLALLIITIYISTINISTNVDITGTNWNPCWQSNYISSVQVSKPEQPNCQLTQHIKMNWVGLNCFVMASGLIWFPINVQHSVPLDNSGADDNDDDKCVVLEIMKTAGTRNWVQYQSYYY